MNNYDESYSAARNAVEVWKKETAISTKKCEIAMKEKDLLLNKMGQMQKEIESLQQQQRSGTNSEFLHAVKRVSELKGLPPAVLKTLEWQLRKDLIEVEKVKQEFYKVSTHLPETTMINRDISIDLNKFISQGIA